MKNILLILLFLNIYSNRFLAQSANREDSIKINCYCDTLALLNDRLGTDNLIRKIKKEGDVYSVIPVLAAYQRWSFSSKSGLMLNAACRSWIHKKYTSVPDIFDQMIRVNAFMSEIGYGTSPGANPDVTFIWLMINKKDFKTVSDHYQKNKTDNGIREYWSYALDLLSQGR